MAFAVAPLPVSPPLRPPDSLAGWRRSPGATPPPRFAVVLAASSGVGGERAPPTFGRLREELLQLHAEADLTQSKGNVAITGMFVALFTSCDSFFREKVSPLYFKETKHHKFSIQIQHLHCSTAHSLGQGGSKFNAVARLANTPSPTSAKGRTTLAAASEVTGSTTLEIILPSDGAEGDVLASRELDRREPIRLGPRIASGCTSLACRDANTWSSNSQSPAANRIRQFFNVLASLLITSFSPNHTLP